MSLSRPAKAAILASGKVLTSCVGLISLAVLSRVFNLREYGTYRQVFLLYAFVSPVLVLGLPRALYYFLPGQKDNPRRILCENLALLFAAGALFSAFLACGGNRLLAASFQNPHLAGAITIFAAYPLLALPLRALGPCLMARDKPKQLAVFNLASRVLLLLAVVGAALRWRTVQAALVATVATSALTLVAGIWLMFRACPGGLERPSRAGAWGQMKFAVPLGVATIFGVLARKLGQVIVSAMCSPKDFAIYANGAIEIPVIGVITGSAMAVILPELARSVKGGERQAALELWQRSMVKCSTILLPAMVFFFICAPDVIRVIFSAKYDASVTPFRILLLALPLRATNFGAMFLAANANKLVMYRSPLDLLVSALFTVVLVSGLGMPGAAAAVVLMLYLWHAPYNAYFIGRLYSTGVLSLFPVKRLALVLASSCAAGAAVSPVLLLLTEASSFVRLALSAAIFGIALPSIYGLLRVYEFRELAHAVLPRRALWLLSALTVSSRRTCHGATE